MTNSRPNERNRLRELEHVLSCEKTEAVRLVMENKNNYNILVLNFMYNFRN